MTKKITFSKNIEYHYQGRNIGKFDRYRPAKEYQTYIWNGYAYFERCIVHYTNYEWICEAKRENKERGKIDIEN